MVFSMPKIILQTLHLEDDGVENKFGILIPYLEFWIAMVMVRGYGVLPSSLYISFMFSTHILLSIFCKLDDYGTRSDIQFTNLMHHILLYHIATKEGEEQQ